LDDQDSVYLHFSIDWYPRRAVGLGVGEIDRDPDDHSHMIDPDHMAHVRWVKQ